MNATIFPVTVKDTPNSITLSEFPLGDFFRAKRKACFHSFVLLHNLKLTCSKQKDKDTLFASREKSRVVENRL